MQYGHIVGCWIHDAGEWCAVVKGGSAYLRIEQNEFSEGDTGGFVAGNGTGFEFMTNPWLHYEAYDIKFFNNLIHHTGTAGMGVNGGYNVLLAYNTLYKVGTNDHVIEVLHGARGCDGATPACSSNNLAGGWGTTGAESSYIPSKNVYIFNNLIYNPTGFASRWQQFAIDGPVIPPAGSHVPSPSAADSNLVIKGNLIWNGAPSLPLGIEDPGTGCQSGNTNCNAAQLLAKNTINIVRPQLVNPEGGDFTPVSTGNVFGVTTYTIPNFHGGDQAQPPLAPAGNLTNTISRDYNLNTRLAPGLPGAFAATSSISVKITIPTNNATYRGPVSIQLTALATNPLGISAVRFYTESTLIGTDSNAPYSIWWYDVPPGIYALTARAADAFGGEATSAVVSIRVLSTNRVLASDFDGDRKCDLTVYEPARGNWYILQSRTATMRVVNWGWNATTPVPGDYDGDHITDLAVYHRATGNWYILPSSGGMRTMNWGWSATIPVPGDYDGDGTADLAVYHPASGNWYIRSLTNGVIAWGVPWGWSAASPVPADYDGDRRTDLAVFNRATGQWYVRSLTNGVLAWGTGWGWNATVPVPDDYDGDGTADLAVYYQAAGSWYARSLTNGVILWGRNWGWYATEPVAEQYQINKRW